MTVALTILPSHRTLSVEPGTSILRAAHGAGIDITATCGGRGRCTSCRVKYVRGTIPPTQVSGVDVFYIVNFATYSGAAGKYNIKFQCTKSGPAPEFTLVEGP